MLLIESDWARPWLSGVLASDASLSLSRCGAAHCFWNPSIASERWEADPNFAEVPSRLLSSHSWKHVMADKWFFDDDILRPEAPALVKAASRCTTAGCCYSVTIFQLYSASTVDDPATSDSLPRSDVLLRCVFRATPGSASDGYRASSTAVTRAAENVTVHCDATKILVDHFGSNDG